MEGKAKAEKIVRGIITAGSVAVLLVLVLIEVWAASYTVYNADDFSIANSMRPYGDSAWEYLQACFRYIKRTYMSWQGTYSSMFIWTSINPLNELGLPQLRVVMVLNTLLYVFSLLFLIFIVFNVFLKGHYHLKLFVSACAVFMIMNSRAYPEAFFWFNGAATYTFPITCLFIALGFLILSNTANRHKIPYAVFASLFGIGSQGGSLAIAGIGCYVVLVLCLLFWLRSKKISAANLAVAFIFLAGALVNTAAPGNYVRHEQFGAGIHPTAMIAPTIRLYLKEIKLIVTNDQFCIILLLLILCGAVLYGKLQYDIKLYTIISGLLLITPLVAIFPVVLGYAGSEDMPNRVLFIINTVTVLVYANMAMAAGYWIAVFIKAKEIKPVRPICVWSILLLVFLVRVLIVSGVRNTIMVRTFSNLYHGKIQEYYADCRDIYEYLGGSNGEADVVIENYPQRVEGFGSFELYSDPNEWVNTCVAKFYYKNSVRTTD